MNLSQFHKTQPTRLAGPTTLVGTSCVEVRRFWASGVEGFRCWFEGSRGMGSVALLLLFLSGCLGVSQAQIKQGERSSGKGMRREQVPCK